MEINFQQIGGLVAKKYFYLLLMASCALPPKHTEFNWNSKGIFLNVVHVCIIVSW